MKIIAAGLNGQYLQDIHVNSLDKTEWVKAAIAYASGHPIFLENFRLRKTPLTFYCRYDQSAPVTLNILKTFLDRKSPSYVCKLVPDIFHPKVIWWGGYGAYIGSANLTENGWVGNIEMGVFFTQEDLVGNGMEEELTDFFEQVDLHSHALTQEIYDELTDLQDKEFARKKSQENDKKKFESKRIIPRLGHLKQISPKNTSERRRNKFLKEWRDTLQILRDIADRVSHENNRPKWVKSSTPKGVQADQFLHAYYYKFAKMGNRSRHHELFELNSINPEKFLSEVLNWWKETHEAPTWEDETFENSKIIYDGLAKGKINQLGENEFIDICRNVHALTDHCLRVKKSVLGLPESDYSDGEKRIRLLGEYLWRQRSEGGLSIIDVLNYVLHSGSSAEVPERIWEALDSAHYRISHFGVSSIGEIVGWALPNEYPPRNGRTSKALRALGYNVRIHSE